MSRCLALALIAAGVVASAAPIPKEWDEQRIRRVYGEWSDPHKDAERKLDRDALQIAFPGRRVWSRQEVAARAIAGIPTEIASGIVGPEDSTRLWRNIPGDFTATVRVSFPMRPKAESLFAIDAPRLAGLVIWWDEKNHISVMRAEEYKAGHGVEAYFSVHKYPNGRLKTATRPDRKTMNESAYLRLVRKGKTIAGSYSFDGKKWIELDSFEARPGTPKVGVFARNASEDRFTASFDHYSLTQPKK